MVVLAVLLTLLSLALAWFRFELFVGNPFDPRGRAAEPPDTLGSLNTVVTLALVLSVWASAYVWWDRVRQYSEEDLLEVLSAVAVDIEEADSSSVPSFVEGVEDLIDAHGDAGRVRVVNAISDDPAAQRWLVTDDDGGSPHCLTVRATSSAGERTATVNAGYC